MIGRELTDFRDKEFDLGVLSILKVVPEQHSKSYVRWQAVFKHWGDLHVGFRKYEIRDSQIVRVRPNVLVGVEDKSWDTRSARHD